MTFIATVRARNGAAIIADSLVTNTHHVITLEEFLQYIESRNKEEESEIKLMPTEILELFQSKPSHTKNFEEKLFKYNNYTCITTAGSARINGKRIEDIIESILESNKKDGNHRLKRVDKIAEVFSNKLKEEVEQHLAKHSTIRPTTFIITSYNKSLNKTDIYKVNVVSASQKNLEDPAFELTEVIPSEDFEKVVCEGQNRISEKILYGDFFLVHSLIPKLFERIVTDLKIDHSVIPPDYIERLRTDNDFRDMMYSDIKMFKLSELSIQQAVELANLLMHIEMDFQNYTENIPTVGGVIKIAIIDKDGFRFISGKDIIKPMQI
jgi:20S proteasome alpha/beta subunit